MTTAQLKALQRYISAVAWFMLHHTSGGGNIAELLAARSQLEAAFGVQLPAQQPKSDLPDLL